MATTYNDLTLNIRRALHEAGFPDATLEARELVCFAAGKSREELTRDARLYAPPALEAYAWELAKRHLAGEPVAYLIGEWEFYGVPLDISRDVLIPRPDTETLVEEVLRELPQNEEHRILDLCSGSGCIGISLACHLPASRVVLGEISDGALRVCRQNIRRNGLTGRVVALYADALQKPDRALGEFTCVTCNPPYIPHGEIETLDVSVRDYEPHLALDGGADGLDFYRAVCAEWKGVLAAGGRLFFEVGAGQADAVLRLMRAQGFGDVEVAKDKNGIPRVVHGALCDEI
ncbi:MAG: peptide chain release factor N(5)-glutamine methyltransferase [Oscillibacter sp.]|nr:peptide chain release factor N(5)-glutamine methyltransferase [Oscillibacter sp.]